MRTTNLIKAAVIAIFTLPVAVHAQTAPQAPKQCLAPNTPVGTPRGIHPGRVAWSHAPGAATWDGSKASAWFDDSCNDYALCRWLVAATLRNLTGEKSEKRAWRAVFTYFNTQRGRQGKSYGKGEKIAIKVNNNNTYSHEDSREINASPQMLLALLESLVEVAGVPQQCITVAEPSRFITDYLYNKCHGRYPGIRFVDNSGGDGRMKAEYSEGAIRFSKDNGRLARGLATAFTEADYVINMALLKATWGRA